jgi:hypothetical protein
MYIQIILQSLPELIIENIEAGHCLIISDLRSIILKNSDTSFLKALYSFLECLFYLVIDVLLKVLPWDSDCHSI